MFDADHLQDRNTPRSMRLSRTVRTSVSNCATGYVSFASTCPSTYRTTNSLSGELRYRMTPDNTGQAVYKRPRCRNLNAPSYFSELGCSHLARRRQVSIGSPSWSRAYRPKRMLSRSLDRPPAHRRSETRSSCSGLTLIRPSTWQFHSAWMAA